MKKYNTDNIITSNNFEAKKTKIKIFSFDLVKYDKMQAHCINNCIFILFKILYA
jgi:hypothetical protein